MIRPGAEAHLLRQLVDSITDHALYMLDAEGRIANWNRGAERVKGWSAAEIVGRHFSVFYTPEDRQAGLPTQALDTAMREGRYEAEGWRLRKDGSRFWASVVIHTIHDETGELLGFAKITRDVSQKRAAELALADSERQFRLLVSSVVDYALYMLDPNGVVISWNAGAQNIKGYAAEEIVGQHFSRFYPDAERAAGVPSRVLQIAREKGRYEAEGWRVRKDGSLFWALVVIDAIHDEDGRLIGFAKITRDMTERRQAQLELQKANERLAHAQKMEAIGALTGGVAHDFNNLLMVVSGQAQLLRGRVSEDPRSLRAVEAIEAAAQRGSALTRHLLAFARRQRLEPVAIALAEQTDILRELMTASLSANVRLSFDIAPDVWPIAADPAEFELALLNLAVNARDAMPEGGSLTLRAENVELDGRPAAHGLQGSFVAISVSDTGSGIAPDILPRVFDPFFTTKDIGKGTGLGLSQVFGFARQSGGWADVSSRLGEGTTFTIYMPRSDGAPRTAQADDRVAEVRGATILLVEDNPEVAEVAAAMLEQLGHDVRAVGNPDAAMTLIDGDDPPDLVFSDIVMAGGMSGLDLARRLRERTPPIPVLLATGYSQAAQQSADEFAILRKPYQLAELSRAIGATLVRRDSSDEKLVDFQAVRRTRSRNVDP
ncbi:MAG: PAS domain S-box protein [Pseudomonadota bacterium]